MGKCRRERWVNGGRKGGLTREEGGVNGGKKGELTLFYVFCFFSTVREGKERMLSKKKRRRGMP